MATATKQNLLPIDKLSQFQRQQMDPNYDYLFGDVECIVNSYDNPCPNGGSDVSYILRYLVKKYHWLKITDLNLMYEMDVNGLKIQVISFFLS